MRRDTTFFKINNFELQNFLLKYIETDLSDGYCVPKRCEETLSVVRILCGKERVCVHINETAYASRRKFADIVIEVLENNRSYQRNHLLYRSRKCQQGISHTTVAHAFDEAMQALCTHGVKFDNVLLLVTHAKPHTKKATADSTMSYPKLIHVTCVAHAFHNVSETVHVLYPNAGKLVASGQKMFVTAPARIELVKNEAPDAQSPPPQLQ
jgi:hypothetical protein